jgi:hypothetical protein
MLIDFGWTRSVVSVACSSLSTFIHQYGAKSTGGVIVLQQ